jgi:endogenous inhibitor of DNA gyrase (YacG/DUF329 family)
MSAAARGRCPVCRKPRSDSFRPFCSRRCADIDLARWLGGTYAIPAIESADDGLSPDGALDEPEAVSGSWTGPGSSSKRPPPRQKPR